MSCSHCHHCAACGARNEDDLNQALADNEALRALLTAREDLLRECLSSVAVDASYHAVSGDHHSASERDELIGNIRAALEGDHGG